MKWCLILVLCFIDCVLSFRTGAPRSPVVCNERLPQHHVTGGRVIQPQNTSSPFIVDINATSLNYSDVIEIRLSVPDENTYFRGFVVQVLPLIDKLNFADPHPVTNPVADLHGVTPVGTFIESSGVKLLSCFGRINTVTHKNGDKKTSIVLYWRAPSSDVFRPFVISCTIQKMEMCLYLHRATMLKEYDVFWKVLPSTLLTLPDIREDGDPTREWLAMITDTASSIYHSKGGRKWKSNIRSRLKLGFKDMGNTQNGVITNYLAKTLPYQGQFKNSESTAGNELYKSDIDPKNSSLSIDTLVKELLKGDFKFADRISDYLHQEDVTIT